MDINHMPAMVEAAVAALLVAFGAGVHYIAVALIPLVLAAAFLADVEAANSRFRAAIAASTLPVLVAFGERSAARRAANRLALLAALRKGGFKALRRRRGLGGLYPIHPLAALRRAAGIEALRAKDRHGEGVGKGDREEFLLHEFMLPDDISGRFPSDLAVVGGMARVAAWCVLGGYPWPEGYQPRDHDYLAFDPSVPFGELRGECLPGLDMLITQSFHSYCAQLDLTSNGVMVENGTLHMDEEAYQAFSSGLVGIRSGNRALERGVSGLEYLCLRAAVQTGYDIALGVYHPRAGALRLDEYTIQCLRAIRPDHWYMGTYHQKLEQVKSGKH
jgi:hypothetical protein